MIDQITVFLENSEGRLAALCRCFADAGVDMYALTIADTTDYGLVRIVCSNPAGAIAALSTRDYRAIRTPVAALEVPDVPGGLAKLMETLDALNINVEYGYCFGYRDGKAIDVFKISDEEQFAHAVKKLETAGFRSLSLEDIA